MVLLLERDRLVYGQADIYTLKRESAKMVAVQVNLDEGVSYRGIRDRQLIDSHQVNIYGSTFPEVWLGSSQLIDLWEGLFRVLQWMFRQSESLIYWKSDWIMKIRSLEPNSSWGVSILYFSSNSFLFAYQWMLWIVRPIMSRSTQETFFSLCILRITWPKTYLFSKSTSSDKFKWFVFTLLMSAYDDLSIIFQFSYYTSNIKSIK